MNNYKSHMYLDAFMIFTLMMSFVVDFPLLRIFVLAGMCLVMFFADIKMATCHFFLYSSFFLILNYGDFQLYIFIALSYILASLIKKSIELEKFLFVVSLFGLCILTGDFSYQSIFKIGDMIPIFMFAQIIFICNSIDPEDYGSVINWFIIGFFIASLLGLFVDAIPSLKAILNIDNLYVYGGSTYNLHLVSRYGGLTYDSNFFGFVVCFVVSIILFRKPVKHQGIYLIIALILAILGFSTLSKSYFVGISIIAIIYISKIDRRFIKRLAIILSAVFVYLIIDYTYNLGYISNIIERFSGVSDLSSLTTKRSTIWLVYLEYIIFGGPSMVFGNGFNSTLFNVAAHNTYIEFMFFFGFVGTFFWYKYFSISYRKVKLKTKDLQTHSTIIPLCVVLTYIFVLSAMSFPQLPVIICMVMFSMNMPDNSISTQNKIAQISEVNSYE